MRSWMKAVFTALAGIFSISLLLWIGTLYPVVCGKLWVVSLSAAVIAGLMFIGYNGRQK